MSCIGVCAGGAKSRVHASVHAHIHTHIHTDNAPNRKTKVPHEATGQTNKLKGLSQLLLENRKWLSGEPQFFHLNHTDL